MLGPITLLDIIHSTEIHVNVRASCHAYLTPSRDPLRPGRVARPHQEHRRQPSAAERATGGYKHVTVCLRGRPAGTNPADARYSNVEPVVKTKKG